MQCNENKVGDQFHLLIECKNPDIMDARELYLPKYYASAQRAYMFLSCLSVHPSVRLFVRLSVTLFLLW